MKSSITDPFKKKVVDPKRKWFIGLAVVAWVGFIAYIMANGANDSPVSSEHPSDSSKVNIAEKLQRDIIYIKSFSPSAFENPNTTSVGMELALLTSYSTDLKASENDSSLDVSKVRNELKKILIPYQQKQLKFLRQAWAKILADKSWEHDVYVTVEGKSCTILNFTGAIYAANKNIKETQEGISDFINKLRFKQVNYRWYKSQDDFQYFTLKTPPDTELFE